MAMGTYTEPHSASAGAPYVTLEKVPPGDLTQIVTNQRTLWNQVKDSARLIDVIVDFKKYVTLTLTTTWTTVYTNDGGSGDPLSYLYSASAPTGDVLYGNVGPFEIATGETGTPTPIIQVKLLINQGSTTIPYLRGVRRPGSGSGTVGVTSPLDFPFVYRSNGGGAITLSVQARIKVSTTVGCVINSPGAAEGDQAYGNEAATPTLQQWLMFQHIRRAPQ